MRFLSYFLCIIIAALLSAHMAHAQSQNSGFVAMPQAISVEDVEMASVDFDEAFGMFDNPFLSDIVKLNYQISLLEKMVERQAELQKIKESFETMGANFDPPPPPRGICAQLPANAACLKHYPELYSDLVSQRRAYYEKLKAEAAAKNPGQAPAYEGESKEEAEARRKKEEAIIKEKLAKIERKKRYQWTNIACISGDCRGVLVAPQKPGFRATVREGSRLLDGTVVESITKSGIVVRIAGETIPVRPAPGEGGTDAAQQDPSEAFMKAVGGGTGSEAMSDAAAKVLEGVDSSGGAGTTAGQPSGGATSSSGVGSATAATTAAASSGAGSATGGGATGQTIAEPPLGPSGLF